MTFELYEYIYFGVYVALSVINIINKIPQRYKDTVDILRSVVILLYFTTRFYLNHKSPILIVFIVIILSTIIYKIYKMNKPKTKIDLKID